ncbi:hypothetical protein F66182_2787 [Fusarium sp. NRRL 66182]|nr:hypothetical protein F66182_2787 [Fusarium sp. NRRL 66182]
MSRNILSFLCQTRKLQRSCRRPPTLLFTQRAGIITNKRNSTYDNSVPFEWPDKEEATEYDIPENEGTLTPSETEIFKSIFDEISQGRLPKAKKPSRFGQAEATSKPTQAASDTPRSGNTLVERARGEVGDDFLKRYPPSLRLAAETALGKFELAPARPRLREMTELDEEEAKQMAEWARYEKIREQEKERVQKLMEACETDVQLWDVMEKEVFSLPEKLGIKEEAHVSRRGRKKKIILEPAKPEKAEPELAEEEMKESEAPEKDKHIMDVHGPLYSHYLATGLKLFDTAFAEPSILAFNILPRVRELGLSSYVLGASTPLFVKLADIHWKRFGDATSAFDALDEMKSVGLFPNENELEDLDSLVQEISTHLHSCTWGAQGPFVMAMMEVPPYDAGLVSRLEDVQSQIEMTRPVEVKEKS